MTMLAQPQYQAAIAAIIGFNIISITSKPFFRKHAYPLFLFSHIVGITVAFVAVCTPSFFRESYYDLFAVYYIMDVKLHLLHLRV